LNTIAELTGGVETTKCRPHDWMHAGIVSFLARMLHLSYLLGKAGEMVVFIE